MMLMVQLMKTEWLMVMILRLRIRMRGLMDLLTVVKEIRAAWRCATILLIVFQPTLTS